MPVQKRSTVAIMNGRFGIQQTRSSVETTNVPCLTGALDSNNDRNCIKESSSHSTEDNNNGRLNESPLDLLAVATSVAEGQNTKPKLSIRKNCKRKAAPSPSDPPTASVEDRNCPICLTQPNIADLSTIDGCKHTFCWDCIEKWSEQENSCPLCKARFTRINRVHKKRKRTKDEIAAKMPVSKNTKTVKRRNQTADYGRIPLTDYIQDNNPYGQLSFFRTLLTQGAASNLNPASSLSTERISSTASFDSDDLLFSDDDDSYSSGRIFPSFLLQRNSLFGPSHLRMTNNTRISVTTSNRFAYQGEGVSTSHALPGSTADTALEIDDSDDDDVMIIPQLPPTFLIP